MKLVSFDRGFWTVEAKGKRFENVFVSSVKAGWLYELRGRWLDEKDPEVIAVKKAVRAPSPERAAAETHP